MEWIFALGVMGLCVVSRGFRILTFVVIGAIVFWGAGELGRSINWDYPNPPKEVACVEASNPYCIPPPPKGFVLEPVARASLMASGFLVPDQTVSRP